MAREDVRDRGKSGGLAGMLNVRQEAFQAVEVIVGLLEQIAERVSPPDRTESFAKMEALTLAESPVGGGGQFVEAIKTIKIADPSSSARLYRISLEIPAQSFDTQSGGCWFFLGDSVDGIPICELSVQGAMAGLVGLSSIEIPAGITVSTITVRALTSQGGAGEMIGSPLRLGFFGELPGRDDT